jgi:hypothetical protein
VHILVAVPGHGQNNAGPEPKAALPELLKAEQNQYCLLDPRVQQASIKSQSGACPQEAGFYTHHTGFKAGLAWSASVVRLRSCLYELTMTDHSAANNALPPLELVL